MPIIENVIYKVNVRINARDSLINLKLAKSASVDIVVNKIAKNSGNATLLILILCNFNRYFNLIHYNRHSIIISSCPILEISLIAAVRIISVIYYYVTRCLTILH